MNNIEGRLLELIGEGSALVFKNLTFYRVGLNNNKSELIVSIPVGKIKSFLCRFRITNRLLRIEPRCSVRVGPSRFFISLLHKVWLLDIEANTINEIYSGRKNFSDCLNLCNCNGDVYWGDYGANVIHEPVNIYRYSNNKKIDIVYTFPAGDVMHIHNIFMDDKKEFFWVLAGDNEKKAGIYKANLNWNEVKPWKTGEQKYRAVVGFPCQGGLLYATDSVETENHLRLIDTEGEEHVICPINGSCIYGCETKEHYLFSTTVEPHEGTGFWRKFDNRLGGGIKSRDVHIIAVSKKDLSYRIVQKLHKDWWPMVFFQYGRVRFAGGQENNSSVWCSPVACCHYDGKSIKLDLEVK